MISIMALKFKNSIKKILIILFWLFVWEISSIIINKPLLFPSPIKVLIRLSQLIITNEFLISSFASLGRIGIGILIAIISGSIVAIICSFSKLVYEFIHPIITVIKATPVASFIILIWIFIGNNITPIFISSLMVFPIVFSNLYQGIISVDKDLMEVCKIYNLPRKKIIRSLYIPSVIPYFFSALLSSIGLGWKAGIAAEVLCTPNNSIGKSIFESKTYIEYIDLFAWTSSVIILSLLFEFTVTKLIKIILKKHTYYKVNPDGN